MTYTINCYYCHFCNLKLNYYIYDTPFDTKINVYYCADCMAEFMYLKSNKRISLYTVINKSTYRISYYASDLHDKIYNYELWFIEEPGVPGKSINKKLKLITSINYELNVNPANVNKKIKNILTFL